MFVFTCKGGGSLQSPTSDLYTRGGERLGTVPCVRFYIGEGDRSLPSPVLLFVVQGVTALYRLLRLVQYSRGGRSLSSSVFWFVAGGGSYLLSPVFGSNEAVFRL